MKDRIRGIIVLGLLVAGYFMYQDNQRLQHTIDAVDQAQHDKINFESTLRPDQIRKQSNGKLVKTDEETSEGVSADSSSGDLSQEIESSVDVTVDSSSIE